MIRTDGVMMLLSTAGVLVSASGQVQGLSREVSADTAYWHVEVTGIPLTAYDISTVDANTAWAAGAAGRIIRTTNAGGSWVLVSSGAMGPADIYGIAAVSESLAVATTTPLAPLTTTRIHRTTNSGTSWEEVYSQLEGFIISIRMHNPIMGTAVGDPVGGYWMIVRSRNQGATWARISTEPPQIGGESGWQRNLATFDTTHLWFGSNSGRGYFSTDGGATWSWGQCASPFTRAWFNSPSLGLALCSGGIYRSTDGGRTWTAVANPTGATKHDIAGALFTSEFWLTSNSGIFHTPDAGNSWTSAAPHGTTRRATMISLVTTGQEIHGWAVAATDTFLHYRRILTSMNEYENPPTGFSLSQNYPNPFNPSTTIAFTLPSAGALLAEGRAREGSRVTLKVFDVLGREVATLVDGVKEPGTHTARWDALAAPSGVYLYRLIAGGFSSTRTMVLVR